MKRDLEHAIAGEGPLLTLLSDLPGSTLAYENVSYSVDQRERQVSRKAIGTRSARSRPRSGPLPASFRSPSADGRKFNRLT